MPTRRAWGSLDRRQIVAAAQRIARREGLSALTIRRLADDLGVSRMSLYRHVADKDDLVRLVLDAIAGEDIVPPVPADAPWQDRLRDLAAAMRRELAAYPGTVDILMAAHEHHGTGALRLVETVLAILADAGLDARDAARYHLVFVDLVLGRLYREAHGAHVGVTTAPDDADDLPRLRAAGPHLAALTGDDVFTAEIDMLIGAVEAAARR